MTAIKNYCTNCRKPRKGIPPAHLHCESCASPLTTTPAKPVVEKTRPPCPLCGSNKSMQLEEGRFGCTECPAVFEDCETSYAGHRPYENVEKKDEYERRQANRRRAGQQRTRY